MSVKNRLQLRDPKLQKIWRGPYRWKLQSEIHEMFELQWPLLLSSYHAAFRHGGAKTRDQSSHSFPYSLNHSKDKCVS